MRHPPFFLLALALIVIPLEVKAQNKGRLDGRVVSVTGEPVPGANVIVEGPQFGAPTDFNGTYFILGIPIGEYDVRVTTPISVKESPEVDSSPMCLARTVRGVMIKPGRTTVLDVLFEEEARDEVIECIVNPRWTTNPGESRVVITVPDPEALRPVLDNLPVRGTVDSTCYNCPPGRTRNRTVLSAKERRRLVALLVIYTPIGIE